MSPPDRRPSDSLDRESVEQQIPGEYQLHALLKGRRFQRAWHRARLDLVEQILPPVPGAFALDAAAGAGMISWRFRQPTIVSADMRVTACEAVRTHSPGAKAIAAQLSALPFRSASFSRIYFLEAIEHLTQDTARQTLQELRRVAKPGTECLITTPNYRSHWVLLEWLIDAMRLTPPMADAQHVSRYNSDTLPRMVESCGWKVTTTGSFNLASPFVGMVSRKAAARILRMESAHARYAGALLYVVCRA